jgi:hypothetical protein
MTVRGYRVRQPDFAHDRETGAIGEREALVAILKEQLTRLFEARTVDAFPAEPRTLIDLFPPTLSSASKVREAVLARRAIQGASAKNKKRNIRTMCDVRFPAPNRANCEGV